MKKNFIILFKFIILFNFFIFPTKSDPMFELGKNIFLNKATCSACHILADAGSNGQIGPNLNEIRPDIGRVINSVTNGIGVMPSMLGILSDKEIEAVAYYVSEASMN